MYMQSLEKNWSLVAEILLGFTSITFSQKTNVWTIVALTNELWVSSGQPWIIPVGLKLPDYLNCLLLTVKQVKVIILKRRKKKG